MVIQIQEGTCRWVTITNREESLKGPEWLEVECETHKWECGHRHTRWGPILRCIIRHVASMIEEEE
jgi:hypothetical protein